MTYPITPPPELVQQWRTEPEYASTNQVLKMVSMTQNRLMELCQKSSQYGADQELEACCKVICNSATNFSAAALLEAQRGSDNLRAARRPKPPSLKEQAMRVLVENGTNLDGRMELDSTDIETIRRALEQLDD
jgi:hypothetical protein